MSLSIPQKTACLKKAAEIAKAAAGSGGNGNMSDELIAKIIKTTMKPRMKHPLAALVIAFLVTTGCAAPTAGQELTRGAYEKAKTRKGVVLLSVNWGRAWGYCGFENVQLTSLAFDRMPVEKNGDEPSADLVLEGPALLAKPVPVNYAFLLEPGEYALTAFHIKAAKSVNDVGAFKAGRTKLIRDGKPLAGSFKVGADEVVYVGHFAPECPQRGQPTIWRYYLKDAAAFRDYLAAVKDKYPFVDIESVQFRLFQTTTIGQDFQLR